MRHGIVARALAQSRALAPFEFQSVQCELRYASRRTCLYEYLCFSDAFMEKEFCTSDQQAGCSLFFKSEGYRLSKFEI